MKVSSRNNKGIDMEKLIEGLAHDDKEARILLAMLIESFQDSSESDHIRKYGNIYLDNIIYYRKEV